MKDCSNATALDKGKMASASSNKSNVSTEMHSNLNSNISGLVDTSSGDSGSANRVNEDKSNFTQIMLDRWTRSNVKSIP